MYKSWVLFESLKWGGWVLLRRDKQGIRSSSGSNTNNKQCKPHPQDYK